MSDPVQMEKDIKYLVEKVKQLRKEKIDLLHQLDERHEANIQTSAEHFSLTEISLMTGGIVHDLRNGLGVIRNTVGFLGDELPESTHQADLNKITQTLDFCELILRNLSSLGGQDAFRPEQANLEEIVREVYLILERKLVDVELVIDADPETPEILADKGQMKQVFMNLIKNAGEAMPNGGKLLFRTRREGNMLRIDLNDTGNGISPENQQRLFKEYFTTKEKGYGLGLHIVRTIAKRHGGKVEVKSQKGEGTTFTIYLPVEL